MATVERERERERERRGELREINREQSGWVEGDASAMLGLLAGVEIFIGGPYKSWLWK
jgi:hypothetical protein